MAGVVVRELPELNQFQVVVAVLAVRPLVILPLLNPATQSL